MFKKLSPPPHLLTWLSPSVDLCREVKRVYVRVYVRVSPAHAGPWDGDASGGSAEGHRRLLRTRLPFPIAWPSFPPPPPPPPAQVRFSRAPGCWKNKNGVLCCSPERVGGGWRGGPSCCSCGGAPPGGAVSQMFISRSWTESIKSLDDAVVWRATKWFGFKILFCASVNNSLMKDLSY